MEAIFCRKCMLSVSSIFLEKIILTHRKNNNNKINNSYIEKHLVKYANRPGHLN